MSREPVCACLQWAVDDTRADERRVTRCRQRVPYVVCAAERLVGAGRLQLVSRRRIRTRSLPILAYFEHDRFRVQSDPPPLRWNTADTGDLGWHRVLNIH